MSENHAVLSASGSAKWLNCPAALALEKLIDEPSADNDYTREGTAAHLLLNFCLETNREPSEFLRKEIYQDPVTHDIITVDQEMVNNVEIAIDYTRRLTSRKGFYEEKVDYSHIAPGGFGIADIILEVHEKVAPGKKVNTLYIIDFKYGAGVKVDAFENSQGMLYALGALNSLELLFEREIKRVLIAIIQPRMDNISEYETSVADLLSWGNGIKEKAQKAYDLYQKAASGSDDIFDPRNFNPSKNACKWCQGRTLKRCKAHAHAGYRAAIDGFDDLTAEQKNSLPDIEVNNSTIKDPAFLDNADLAVIWRSASLFKSFIEDLDTEIARRINAGQTVPGLKLIPTIKNRTWKGSKEDAIKAMRTAGLQKQDYLKYDIISPTEAEKKLEEIKPKDHKRRYKRLEATAVHRPPGKDKIVEDNKKAEAKSENISLDISNEDLGFDLLE